jgi:hypothetical protein
MSGMGSVSTIQDGDLAVVVTAGELGIHAPLRREFVCWEASVRHARMAR